MHGKHLNLLLRIMTRYRDRYQRFVSDLEYTRLRKKPKGGGRKLRYSQKIYDFNAWDSVDWDEEQEQKALEAVTKNASQKIRDEDCVKFRCQANKFWDSFYDLHKNRFFKDRHWLFTEFPELAPMSNETEATKLQKARQIFELGCGVGNTILPILKYSKEPNLKVFACDFSHKAIEILRTQSEFDANRCEVFVMDATLDSWMVPFPEESLDIIVLIFVLSAIEPERMQTVVNNCYKYLRSGGLVLFRDYGRYDLAQLRFKSGKCLQDNFYVRGDGTLVYFFTQEEVRKLFVKAGLEEVSNFTDRRLQVNRGRLLKMYRVWIQAKFRKPFNLS